MIRLSRLADYGIVVMTQVARQPRGRVHAARQLSERTGLPLPTVGKVLKRLGDAGLLVSQRGAGGGYSLGRPSSRISVMDMIQALDGPVSLTVCSTRRSGDCTHARGCPARRNWRVINDSICATLAGLSLADMAGRLERVPLDSPRRRRAYGRR